MAIHDFSPPPPPPPPSDPPKPPPAQLGDGAFGLVKKKRSQLFVDAKYLQENFTQGHDLKDILLTVCMPK